MASKSSFLPRISLGGNGSPILPTYHQRSKSNDYDLSELSPRPSSPLLSPDHVRDFGFQDSASYNGNGSSNLGMKGKGKGKGKAVAYAQQEEHFPPISVVDRMRVHREKKATSRVQERQTKEDSWSVYNGPSWKPPSPSDYRDEEMAYNQRPNSITGQSPARNLGSSFMDLLNPTRSTAERSPVNDVDNTFRTIRRREHQIQRELQKLLDAQAAALDQGEASNGTNQDGNDTPRGTSRASSSPYRSRSTSSHEGSLAPTVIPVRQPKTKPLNIRQVRNSIARSMAMLSDLKEEEDAYIASAISARKTALARANKLAHQHKAIATDLRTLEIDDPLRRELEGMDEEHDKVSGDIQELEGRLRALKHRKRVLESRMEEVRSERESGLSGYKGALRETERDIGEMMRMPGVKVLFVDDIPQVPQLEGVEAETKDRFSERTLTGHEFMRMRPERRTIAMAKEWWESEMAVLDHRREIVHTERNALSEGSEIWGKIVLLICDYETRLATALNSSMQVRPSEREKSEAELFQAQFQDLRQTIEEMENELHYVEGKGWNLLVAAIGAELEGFMEGENILAGLMKAKGYGLPENKGLLDLDENKIDGQDDTRNISSSPNKKFRATEIEGTEDDEMTGSVVRRWGGQSETRISPPLQLETSRQPDLSTSHDEVQQDVLGDDNGHTEDDDNEVPADLLVSRHPVDESEDEHANEVPSEFLSVHHTLRETKTADDNETEDDNRTPRDLLGEGTRDEGVD